MNFRAHPSLFTFESQLCYSPAVHPWDSHLTSLSSNFLMGLEDWGEGPAVTGTVVEEKGEWRKGLVYTPCLPFLSATSLWLSNRRRTFVSMAVNYQRVANSLRSLASMIPGSRLALSMPLDFILLWMLSVGISQYRAESTGYGIRFTEPKFISKFDSLCIQVAYPWGPCKMTTIVSTSEARWKNSLLSAQKLSVLSLEQRRLQSM